MKEPRSLQGNYIPTLDGWRAVAICMVLAYHDRTIRLGSLSDSVVHRFGSLGVDLFFAISGFLICTRLLAEEKDRHVIDVGRFYLRRAFRILPAAMCYLFAVASLRFAGVIKVDWHAWLAALLFYRNYYSVFFGEQPGVSYTAHFWTLSLEEHFYLILPAFLLVLRKHREPILAATLLLALAWNEVVHLSSPLTSQMGGEYADRRTELHIAGILFGALLAIVLDESGSQHPIVRRVTPVRVLLAGLVFWLVASRLGDNVGARMVVPLLFPLLIVSTVLHPTSFLGCMLELRPVRFLGKLSYSIYLWQQLFFTGDHANAARMPLSFLQTRPMNYVATLGCALASYYLIERPTIQLGSRLMRASDIPPTRALEYSATRAIQG